MRDLHLRFSQGCDPESAVNDFHGLIAAKELQIRLMLSVDLDMSSNGRDAL